MPALSTVETNTENLPSGEYEISALRCDVYSQRRTMGFQLGPAGHPDGLTAEAVEKTELPRNNAKNAKVKDRVDRPGMKERYARVLSSMAAGGIPGGHFRHPLRPQHRID